MSVTLVGPFAPCRGSYIPRKPGTGGGHMPNIISIDPGRNTGWAMWAEAKPHTLLACGVGAPPYKNACKVVIELPQVYPHSPVNPNDLITLAFLAGRYIGDFGGEAEFVLPHAWKQNLPKNVSENRCRMRLSSEELAVTAVAESLIPKGQCHDMWDSIGIGLVCFRGVKL
jgi:hypothetical protein